MSYNTRKQFVTCASLVYLVLVTALSAYGTSRTNRLSSPISDALSGLTTALPIIAGLLLEGAYDLTRRQERRRGDALGQTARPPIVIIANTIILIYSSVVVTLLGTHAAPGAGLKCGLEEGWKKMFMRKDSEAIRAIQDAFKCCGFINSHDRAWPFPGGGNDIHSCEVAFGRKTGCLGPWRREEQNMAGILIGVVGLVLLWQFVIIATPTKKESWLHRVVPDRVSRIISDEYQNSSNGGPRRAIDYHSNFNNYSDNVPEEISEDEAESTPRQTQRTVQDGAADEEDVSHSAIENAWARN